MPFESLKETLLRGGVAPRHVRRYARELTDHLADLTQAQREAGYDAGDAVIRARALLGDDRELAAAMLAEPRLRAIAARFPWAVFGLLPFVTLVLMFALPVAMVIGVGKLIHVLEPSTLLVAPLWFQFLAGTVTATVNFSALPLVALLFTVIAWRQRLSPRWVMLGVALLCLPVTQAGAWFPNAQEILQHKTAALNVGLGFSMGMERLTKITADWLWFAPHYLLTVLPLGWLVWTHRRMAKASFSS